MRSLRDTESDAEMLLVSSTHRIEQSRTAARASRHLARRWRQVRAQELLSPQDRQAMDLRLWLGRHIP